MTGLVYRHTQKKHVSFRFASFRYKSKSRQRNVAVVAGRPVMNHDPFAIKFVVTNRAMKYD